MTGTSGWSLTARLTRGFALVCAALSLLILSIGYYYVRTSVDRAIEALAREELDEIGVRLSYTKQRVESFEELARVLNGEHPTTPFAWRLWNAGDGKLLSTYDPASLLGSASAPLEAGAQGVYKVGPHLWWSAEEVVEGLRVGLLIDGSAPASMLWRYATAGLVGVLIATLLATLAGALFARRVGRILADVAHRARNIHAAHQDVELATPDAPEEIRDIVDALQQMLGNIRAETENARLITAGLAHELRSPIQNLLGEAEVTLLRERTSDEYRAVLDGQLEELRDLGRVVDNLVALTAPKRHAQRRISERFDLGEEAELRLHRERLVGERRGVRLELVREGDLSLHGDREALLLALRNLVGNAIQWSNPGGTVRLELRDEDTRLAILVDDAGPGVAESERERIFEPFVTGAAKDGARVGYGLGLALTRTAVEAHGGTIRVETSPQGGARFALSLPREPAPDTGSGEFEKRFDAA